MSTPVAQPVQRPNDPGSTLGPSARGAPPPRRVKLQQLLFLLLLLPGILPMLFSSYHLIETNRETLKTQETELLTQSAQGFVAQISENLSTRRIEMQQLGRGIVEAPGPESLEERLRSEWVLRLLRGFAEDHPDLLVFAALSPQRAGPRSGTTQAPQIQRILNESFDSALRSGETSYRFAALDTGQEPAVVITVPIPAPAGETLVLQALMPLAFGGGVAERETFEPDDFFLIDSDGHLLWSAGSQPQIERALLESDLVRDFVGMPFSITREYDLRVGDEVFPTLARVVEVAETQWGLVAHKSSEVAFQQVRRMVFDTVLSSVLAVMLALFFAIAATRWFSRPIQRLAETSHEIAAGKFDRRVPVDGLMTAEIADMAKDFNRMSAYVERYIEQLRKAAEANRALFVSSIRAFAAAIDAKDPYTRGHSERVAAYSRSIAKYLGLPKDVQERIWLAGVLHDVGKIGVQDRVLQKQGVLTPEEFEQMKLHPVIGADIIEPIAALREMIPGIRWHHEAWNGTGYPDRLEGEKIPLMARIIGVADTFDAITTNRPYQTASSPEYAIETIKKLTGTKFDAKVVTAFLLAWEAGHLQLDRQRAEQRSQQLAAAPAPALAAPS
ncbi:MAG: HD domain-containing phosphohydrolase [Acidobacteriota bacterium]